MFLQCFVHRLRSCSWHAVYFTIAHWEWRVFVKILWFEKVADPTQDLLDFISLSRLVAYSMLTQEVRSDELLTWCECLQPLILISLELWFDLVLSHICKARLSLLDFDRFCAKVKLRATDCRSSSYRHIIVLHAVLQLIHQELKMRSEPKLRQTVFYILQ